MVSDHMHGLDPVRLLRWILEDLNRGSALGIVKDLFFIPQQDDPFRLQRYGVALENPLGVAAGPHTQMAQNIVAAWLCGARYMELKTVQVLDQISVSKPCIDMHDEGYNCEWSQELSLEQSYEEYLKAWMLIHVLHDRLGFAGAPGVIFNMSAGYSMEGILSPGVQNFLNRMQNCGDDVRAMQNRLASVYPRAAQLDIPGCMSNSLTISCMHGCPPEEVEKISLYFLQQRRLNTTLKMNPTLLGADRVRGILNQNLGYEATVPDIAFEHDISYETALRIVRNCCSAASDLGLAFSVKLTNTLETLNSGQRLPEKENMVYMSGRPLYPISIAVAEKLQKDFNGGLDISFCAGVDAFNVADTLACGLAPVTVCSDLLKPGGYGRLAQYVENLRTAMRAAGAASLAGFPAAVAALPDRADRAAAVLHNLAACARAAAAPGSRYAKQAVRHSDVKTSRPLPALDCADAPCMSQCPAGQNIPAYMERCAAADMDGAASIITATNPFPAVLGAMCNQACREKCMRGQYDEGLQIRAVKGCVARLGNRTHSPAPANGRSVAVIGAGPAGLSCAYYLALAGCSVDVYEGAQTEGGRTLAPILEKGGKAAEHVRQDVDAILALGVRLHRGKPIDDKALADLAGKTDAVYISSGVEGLTSADARNIFRSTPSGSRGPASTLVAGVGEGSCTSSTILARLGILPASNSGRAGMNQKKAYPEPTDLAGLRRKQAFRLNGASRASLLPTAPDAEEAARKEAARCLHCDQYCGACVALCPNRANVLLSTTALSWPIQEAFHDGQTTHIRTLGFSGIQQPAQIVNIGDFCNECGNCRAFCPSSGAPYKDKMRLHLSRTSFDADANGFWSPDATLFYGKRHGKPWSLRLEGEILTYEDDSQRTVLDRSTLIATKVTLRDGLTPTSLLPAVEASVFCGLVSADPALASIII